MREKKAINVQIGTNIQVARETAGYTQEKLSELIGLTPNHLSAIERGVSGASLEVLEKLCLLLNISADFLLFGQSSTEDEALMLARQISNIDPERKEHVKKAICALLALSAM
ncbi:MAG: helix-turn-helix transcriptional regulator [Oscillospiraceae bacterium]|nr:helix-turn-helix transcriptional regulator [Oscillospiraceae bacterium]